MKTEIKKEIRSNHAANIKEIAASLLRNAREQMRYEAADIANGLMTVSDAGNEDQILEAFSYAESTIAEQIEQELIKQLRS